LRLPSENRKISRFHAEIELEENGEVWVKALHKNPTIVSGQGHPQRRTRQARRRRRDYDLRFTLKLKF
jgi:hypothetical protein